MKKQNYHLLECFPYFVMSKNSFIHYTCNPPSKEILNKHGINFWNNFWIILGISHPPIF